jgi:Zn-dependent M28 family amino/carboxypeptidase
MSTSHFGHALRCLGLATLTLGCASFVGGCPAASDGPKLSAAFDAARAWKQLEAQVALGPRPPGSEALEKTRVYLESELKAAGLAPQREPFKAATPFGEIAMCNVFADFEGKPYGGKPAPMIVIGSHFDTKKMGVAFVGANDGGSSTAVLLEIARVIATSGQRNVTYRFLFLDGEEALRTEWVDPDNRYGSKYHAEQLKKSGAAANVKAFVLLDMVGDKDLKLVRESYSDSWLLEAFMSAAKSNGLGAHFEGQREAITDDHLSFLSIGVPSVDMIDFDYGPSNAYWHTSDDTLDKCSQESLGAIGKITLLGLPAVEDHILR